MNIFKPEDFKNIYKQVMKQGYMSHSAGDMWEPSYRPEDIAVEVNAKLNALISDAPVVYKFASAWLSMNGTEATHGARLICIEKLVKEPCKHEADFSKGLAPASYLYPVKLMSKCKHCGVELVAKWEEKV